MLREEEKKPQPAFAHPSEEEFARILDFYRIVWMYEATTFPIRWDSHRKVVEAFTPDFYLPNLDLYVELTTRDRKLMNSKRRKIRTLQELTPDIKIKLLDRKDYDSLLIKFGIEPRAQVQENKK